MARHLDMDGGPRLVLTLETAISDVLCVVLALGFLEGYKQGALDIMGMARDLAISFGLSAAIGFAAGLMWSLFLNKIRLVRNNIFLTLALVLVLFGGLELLRLSGGIAALCFGAAITNSASLNIGRIAGGRFGRGSAFTDREKAFFSEAVFLLKTFFFVYLGLSLRFGNTRQILFATGLILLKIAIRIPFVRLAMPREVTARDASLMSVMASMGLASAVLASLPYQEGVEGGELIRDLTYAIILSSILLNSVSVFLLDRTPLGKGYQRLFGGFAKTPENTASREDAPLRTQR